MTFDTGSRISFSLILSHGLPRWCSSKASQETQKNMGSIPGLRRSPEVGDDNPLQHSCLKNPMGRRAWWATVHGVTKSLTWLKGLAPAPVLSCNIYWALRLTWMGTERKVSEWKFKCLLEGWYWRLKLCLTKQQEVLEGQPDLGVQRKHILWSPRFLRLRELQQWSFIAHFVFSLGIFSVVTHIYVMISLWNTGLDRRKYFQLTLCS